MILLGGQLLLLVNKVQTIEQGREMIRESFRNGSALQKFHDMIIGQGVSKEIAEKLIQPDESIVHSILPLASIQHRAYAAQQGFIQSIDSFKLGTIVQRLGKYLRKFLFIEFARMFSGGGRMKSTDRIDFSIGIRLLKHVGDEIHENEPWAILYVNDDAPKRYPKFLEDFYSSLQISSTPVEPLQRIHQILS